LFNSEIENDYVIGKFFFLNSVLYNLETENDFHIL